MTIYTKRILSNDYMYNCFDSVNTTLNCHIFSSLYGTFHPWLGKMSSHKKISVKATLRFEKSDGVAVKCGNLVLKGQDLEFAKIQRKISGKAGIDASQLRLLQIRSRTDWLTDCVTTHCSSLKIQDLRHYPHFSDGNSSWRLRMLCFWFR